MQQIIINSTLLLFLTAAGWIDWKKLELPVLLLLTGAGFGILTRILTGQADTLDMAAGSGIGLVVLLIGYASGQALGYGDGLLIAAAGIYLGGTGTLVLLLSSLLIAAIVSMVFIVSKKKNAKERIAFAPFVLAGFVFMKGVFG